MYEETMETAVLENTTEPTTTVEAQTSAIPETIETAAEAENTPEVSCMPLEAQEKRQKWSAFVEGPAVDFFTGYKLEKMTIDDGSGNKAKFSRTKDDGIKVEYTSSVLL